MYTYMMCSTKWFYKSKNAACTIPDILRIYFLIATRTHGKRFSYATNLLIWFLIHTQQAFEDCMEVHIHQVHPPYRL